MLPFVLSWGVQYSIQSVVTDFKKSSNTGMFRLRRYKVFSLVWVCQSLSLIWKEIFFSGPFDFEKVKLNFKVTVRNKVL